MFPSNIMQQSFRKSKSKCIDKMMTACLMTVCRLFSRSYATVSNFAYDWKLLIDGIVGLKVKTKTDSICREHVTDLINYTLGRACEAHRLFSENQNCAKAKSRKINGSNSNKRPAPNEKVAFPTPPNLIT